MNPTSVIPTGNLTVDTTGTTPYTGANPSAPTGSKPNFFERLLPTAGGILGGIGGEAVDLFGGGVAGAAAGNALGKYLENKLTGQSGGNGVVSSAIEGGAGQGVGGILGKIGGKLLGAVSNKASDVADSALQSQFKSPIDKNVVSGLSDAGLSDARQVSQIAPMLSGSNGAYTNMVKDSLQQAGQSGVKVNVSSLDSHLGELLGGGDTGTGAEILKPAQLKAANDFVQKVISPTNLNATPEADRAIMTATPDKTYEAFQKLRNASANLRTGVGAQPGTANNALSQIYGKMADYLKDMSFNPSGLKPIPLTDDVKSQLIDGISSIKDVNPKVYASEVSNITNAKNLSDLNDMQTGWVQASKALQKGAITGAVNTGTSASDIAAGLAPLTLAHPAMTAAGLIMKSPTADRAATSVLGKLSKVTGNATAKKMIPLLTRASTVAAANLPNDVSAPNNVQSPTGESTMNPATPGATAATNPTDQYYQALLAQLQAQPADAQTSSILGALNNVVPVVQKQEQVAPAVENALATYANAGGAQGTGGGLLSRLTGLIPGTAANTFNSQSTAAASQLASLLGITPAQAQALLPQLMQNQQTAAPQISGVQSILGSIGTNQPSAIPAV